VACQRRWRGDFSRSRLVTDASAPPRRSDIVGNVVRAPSARLSAWRRLDRYAARYENFVLVVRPQSGPARGARKKILVASRVLCPNRPDPPSLISIGHLPSKILNQSSICNLKI
jgi:hypothetical protein